MLPYALDIKQSVNKREGPPSRKNVGMSDKAVLKWRNK